MEALYFENQLRAFNVVLASLKASTKDICKKCIGLEAAKTKIDEMLKKLKIDLEKSDIPNGKKKELITHIEFFSKINETLSIEEHCECQKGTGLCKIGSGCFASGAFELFKQITEPKSGG